jgi:hypothetical protein
MAAAVQTGAEGVVQHELGRFGSVTAPEHDPSCQRDAEAAAVVMGVELVEDDLADQLVGVSGGDGEVEPVGGLASRPVPVIHLLAGEVGVGTGEAPPLRVLDHAPGRVEVALLERSQPDALTAEDRVGVEGQVVHGVLVAGRSTAGCDPTGLRLAVTLRLAVCDGGST